MHVKQSVMGFGAVSDPTKLFRLPPAVLPQVADLQAMAADPRLADEVEPPDGVHSPKGFAMPQSVRPLTETAVFRAGVTPPRC